MQTHSYIIHLPRTTMRKANVALLADAAPGTATIVDANDALDISAKDAAEWTATRMHFPLYPFPLRKTEIACFLSHRTVWQRILDSGESGAFVFEDDVVLDPPLFDKARALAMRHAGPDDFIRFPCVKREAPGTVIQDPGHVRLFYPASTGLGMQAQYVGRAAASRLLEATKHFDRPVDAVIQMTWLTGQATKVVWPSGVSEISSDIGGSTIGANKSALERLYRETVRPLYRAAIWIAARTNGAAT